MSSIDSDSSDGTFHSSFGAFGRRTISFFAGVRVGAAPCCDSYNESKRRRLQTVDCIAGDNDDDDGVGWQWYIRQRDSKPAAIACYTEPTSRTRWMFH